MGHFIHRCGRLLPQIHIITRYASLVTRHSLKLDCISQIRDTPYEADYLHYLSWIAESFSNNGLQHFHQKIMTTYITYLTANDYYMPTYWRDRKTCKLRTEAEN